MLAIINYVYHPIDRDVIPGSNVVMVMHFVLIISMNKIVQIGGVIPIMEHFFVKIESVSMKLGVVMERMIVVIILMKSIVHRVFLVV